MKKTPNCPKCKGSMVARKGPKGDFFGCSNYPKCTATSNKRFPLHTFGGDFMDNVVAGDFNTRKG